MSVGWPYTESALRVQSPHSGRRNFLNPVRMTTQTAPRATFGGVRSKVESFYLLRIVATSYVFSWNPDFLSLRIWKSRKLRELMLDTYLAPGSKSMRGLIPNATREYGRQRTLMSYAVSYTGNEGIRRPVFLRSRDAKGAVNLRPVAIVGLSHMGLKFPNYVILYLSLFFGWKHPPASWDAISSALLQLLSPFTPFRPHSMGPEELVAYEYVDDGELRNRGWISALGRLCKSGSWGCELGWVSRPCI